MHSLKNYTHSYLHISIHIYDFLSAHFTILYNVSMLAELSIVNGDYYEHYRYENVKRGYRTIMNSIRKARSPGRNMGFEANRGREKSICDNKHTHTHTYTVA